MGIRGCGHKVGVLGWYGGNVPFEFRDNGDDDRIKHYILCTYYFLSFLSTCFVVSLFCKPLLSFMKCILLVSFYFFNTILCCFTRFIIMSKRENYTLYEGLVYSLYLWGGVNHSNHFHLNLYVFITSLRYALSSSSSKKGRMWFYVLNKYYRFWWWPMQLKKNYKHHQTK